jgi:hypothetical protein
MGVGLLAVGPLTMVESTVSGNTATVEGGSGGAGGKAEATGVFVVGSTTIAGSTISGNTGNARGGPAPANATQVGGSAAGSGLLSVQSTTTPSSIAGTTISGNSDDVSGGPGAKAGEVAGGGLLVVVSSGPMSLSNTTIASNTSRVLGTGGGKIAGAGILAVAGPGGSIPILSTTIDGNGSEASGSVEGEGGNVLAVGQVSFGNSIVAGGFGPLGTENCKIIETSSKGFNIDSLDQCGFHAAGDKVNTNPLLGPLQNNGGPTQTMAPALSSPAIDQGAALGLTSDQRGVLRPIDFPTIPNSAGAGADGSDIGAYELQPSNAFSLGKLKKNKKKGTATLSVTLTAPVAGTLSLTGKGVKAQTLKLSGADTVQLKVVTKGGAAKALRKKGKRKVKLEVTYAPTGNSALTQSRTTKLVRKHRKKHRKHANR